MPQSSTKKRLNMKKIITVAILALIFASCASTSPVNVGTGTKQFKSCGAWISK
tara:strand:+ start:181 stop:339 length:159 start_codon:yes stop_codon:yes gene_type:complete